MQNKKSDGTLISIVFLVTLLLFFLITLVFNFKVHHLQQFTLLAESFLRGKTYFIHNPENWTDSVLFGGRYYWSLFPFPAVILMPCVYVFGLFGKFFYQGYLQFFLVLGVFYLVFKLAKGIKYASRDALYFAFAFCFASVFIGVALTAVAWSLAQVITVFLLLVFLVEFTTKKRYLILGIIIAALLLTRATAALSIVLVILDIVFTKNDFATKLKHLVALLCPVFVSFLFLGLYNFVRFHSLFGVGYERSIIDPMLVGNRDKGLFSPVHIPANIYYLMFASPGLVFWKGMHILKFPFVKVDPWGMSIFFTSPYLLMLSLFRYKDKLSKLLLLTCLIVLVPILCYYGIGYYQFGYRYALDFLPLLFFLFMKEYRESSKVLSNRMKMLFVLIAFSNFYLFMTFVNLI